MDITTILIPILIVVGIIVLAALAWMLVELVKIVKDARIALDESTKRLYPTLDHVEVLTDSLKPTVAKLDPLMDRITLTVDSVNLELMRVDTILENVSDISDSASSASDAVDSITHAPLKVVNSVTDRVKGKFGGKNASDESAMLAEQRVAVAQALEDYKAAEEKDAKKAAKAAKVAEEAELAAQLSEQALTGEDEAKPEVSA